MTLDELRVGAQTWTLTGASFGLGASGEWSLVARRLDATRNDVGPLTLFGYATPWPTSDLAAAKLTATVEDSADLIVTELDGRLRFIAPFSGPDCGAVLCVEALTPTTITLSYAGAFLVCNDEIEHDDRPIDVELQVTATRE